VFAIYYERAGGLSTRLKGKPKARNEGVNVVISEIVSYSNGNWRQLKKTLKRSYIYVKKDYGTFSVQKSDIIDKGATAQELRDKHPEHFV